MIQVRITETDTDQHLGTVNYPNIRVQRTPAWAARNARIIWADKNRRLVADITADAWEVDTENRACDTGHLPL